MVYTLGELVTTLLNLINTDKAKQETVITAVSGNGELDNLKFYAVELVGYDDNCKVILSLKEVEN